MAKRIAVDYEKLARYARGNHDHLSEELGIAKNTLSGKVNGHILLRIEELDKIAASLRMHTTDFFIVADDGVPRRRDRRRGGGK